MFDFSIGELMVVMVVALVVIGPERLPKVARTMGHLYGRAQRYVNGVKSDIARDMAIDEYRQLQQKIQAEASSMQASVQQAAQTVSQQMQEINRVVAEQVAEVRQTSLPVSDQSSSGSGAYPVEKSIVAPSPESASPQGSLFDMTDSVKHEDEMIPGAKSTVKS